MGGQVLIEMCEPWDRVAKRKAMSIGPYMRGRYRGEERRTDFVYGLPGLRVNWARYVFTGHLRVLSSPAAEPVPELGQRVLKALEASTTDFRKRETLARELGATEVDIVRAVADLGDRVRSADATDPRYEGWYRLTSQGKTWRERVREVRAVLGKTPIQ